MDKGVRNNLANDDFAQTFTDIPLQKERIGKMLARKFHEAVVGRYQIDADYIAVIVAVDVPDSQNGICNVSRANVLNDIFRPEQHDGGKVETALAGLSVSSDQLRAAQELVVIHVHPRMAALVAAVVLCTDAKPLQV